MLNDKSRIAKIKYRLLAIIFWITVWHLASIIINKEMRLASPFAVIDTLFKLSSEFDFWISIFHSFYKIIYGFLLATIVGAILAVASFKSILCEEMISPILKIIKATPVASFIILALLWIKSQNLSILISFLMVIPLIYANILQGLRSTDYKLLEMAKVFQLSLLKRIRYIYIPSCFPYFISACSVGLGFCWKAGIAAEVIGLPNRSIGEQLYEAKLYLMTKELFAWTIVIILISVLFEEVVIKLITFIQKVVTKTIT